MASRIKMKLMSVWMLAAVCVLAAGPSRAETSEKIAEEVARTEIAFAKTMFERDLEAFTSFVAKEAVFFGADRVVRGRDAKGQWKVVFDKGCPPCAAAP